MYINIKDFLNPRIEKHCLPLYCDGYYKHAALEAMMQVELALKEKISSEGGSKDKRYGVFLVKNIFGKNHPSIKLKVPLGEDLQSDAEILFTGAFKYYRNYCAHDGSKVDAVIGLRIIVLASELLDLIGASELSYEDIGGIDDIVKTGAFKDKVTLHSLLDFLDGYTLPDEVSDGFYDDLYERGFDDSQLRAVLEFGLIIYRMEDYLPPPDLKYDSSLPDTIA